MAENPEVIAGTATASSIVPVRLNHDRTRLVAAVVAFVVPLLFAFYTRQVWEDYYITFRSSRNLAEGHGLVYQVGEQVQTFTSPLGVLLPALGYALTGNDASALWFFRLLGAGALAGAAALVVNHARDQGWSRTVLWFVLCLGLFEGKVTAFSANGMETALLLFFTALTWHELTRPAGFRRRWLALGYAGLMWTRPDACVLAGAMTFSWWFFARRESSVTRRLPWRPLAGAVLLGAVVYLPWFAWAWIYYGSPVPQTVIAKSALTPGGFSVVHLLQAPFRCLVQKTSLDGLFGPIYLTGGWPGFVMAAGAGLARLSAFLWLLPALPRPTRAASLAGLVGGIYLSQIQPYPWYYAPWTLLGALALGGGAWTLLRRMVRWQSVLRVAVGVVAAGVLAMNVLQAYAARNQQAIVEDHGRRQIGLWLRAHAAPRETVFLEPIGYIGYFSRLKILDFPGLVAPEVSRIVRSGPGGYARIITTLKPDWLVLRPYEIANQNLQDSGILAAYDLAGSWSQLPQIDALDFLPGRYWLVFDAEFVVYHRRSGNPAVPARP